MTDLPTIPRSIIGVLVVLLAFTVIGLNYQKEAALTAAISVMSMVVGYYYGAKSVEKANEE
jgi:hypothetical protein